MQLALARMGVSEGPTQRFGTLNMEVKMLASCMPPTNSEVQGLFAVWLFAPCCPVGSNSITVEPACMHASMPSQDYWNLWNSNPKT